MGPTPALKGLIVILADQFTLESWFYYKSLENNQYINEQYKYNLGKNSVIEGGPNIIVCDSTMPYKTTLDGEFKSKCKLEKKHNLLYHLLTDKKTFKIIHFEIRTQLPELQLLVEQHVKLAVTPAKLIVVLLH
jgi:hypothetical protein